MMKTYKILFLFFILPNFISAQSLVALVTNGQGSTPLEAQHNALRSALEQSFGVYISSETKILNDILVKDEISAITNGKIIDFEVLNQTKIDKDDYLVTVRAKVSIEDLASLVNNKGSNVDFKGNIFAMNIKQEQLNERAEKVVIDKLIVAIVRLFKQSFDFEISIKDPTIKKKNEAGQELYSFPIEIKSYYNENLINALKLLESTISDISMSEDDVHTYIKQQREYYPIYIANEPPTLINPFVIETIKNKQFNKNGGILYQINGNSIEPHALMRDGAITAGTLKRYLKYSEEFGLLTQTLFSYSPFPNDPDYKPYKNSYLRNESSFVKIKNLLNDSLNKYTGYFDVSDGSKIVIPDGFGHYKFDLSERDLKSLRKYFNISEYRGIRNPLARLNREQLIDTMFTRYTQKKYKKKGDGKIIYNQRPDNVKSYLNPNYNKIHKLYYEKNRQYSLDKYIYAMNLRWDTDRFPSPYIQYWEYAKLLKYTISIDATEEDKNEIKKLKDMKHIKLENRLHFDYLHSKIRYNKARRGAKRTRNTTYILTSKSALSSTINSTYIQFNHLSKTTDKLVATFSFKDYKTLSEIENMKGYTVKVRTN